MAKKRSLPRRILKWTGITIATLIVLIIIAIVVIPHVVNTGPVKREIEGIASQRTGRAVTIAGPISLSLFPWVGFDAKNVGMANAPGFGREPFLHVNELEIHVRLIPLLFRNVQVSGITLDQPTIMLKRKADGTSNWQDLSPHKHRGTGEKSPGKKRGGMTKLFIGRITVNNATLDYTDARSGKHYTVSAATLGASGIAPGKPFPLNLRFDLASQHPHLKAEVRLNTQARYDSAANTVTLSDGLFLSKISQAGLGAESLPVNIQWQSITLDQAAGTANFADLALQVANMKAILNGKANGLGNKPMLDAHLEVPTFAPRPFFAALGKPIPTTFAGFRQAGLAAHLEAGAHSATLTQLRLRLDNTTLTGRLTIADFATKALRFDLAADRIDLDNYLPAESKQPAPVVRGHGKNFSETRLPATLLQGLDLAGTLAVGKLTGFGLFTQHVSVKLKAGDGRLRADPITATLYGGSLAGRIRAAAAGPGIRLDTTQKLTGVNVGQLLTAISGSERLSGTGNATVRLGGAGNSVAELLDNLKGQTAFDIKRGAIEGINLWQSLEQAYVLVKEHRKIPVKGPNRTEFTDFEGTAKLADGILDNNALSAALPHITISGHGKLDFKRKSLDYSLLGEVHDAPKTADADLSRLDGLAVPIRVSGGFSDLSVRPDIQGIVEAKAKSELQKKFEEQKASVEDQLKQKLQDLLGGGNGGGG